MSTNEPAFPIVAATGDPRDGVYCSNGLTKREYAAIQIMSTLITRGDIRCGDKTIDTQSEYATAAVDFADALLLELSKSQNANGGGDVNCECVNWCRTAPEKYVTNHHPNCPHYNDSLIDVWEVTDGRATCVYENKPDALANMLQDIADGSIGLQINEKKMHREAFEQLREFEGF